MVVVAMVAMVAIMLPMLVLSVIPVVVVPVMLMRIVSMVVSVIVGMPMGIRTRGRRVRVRIWSRVGRGVMGRWWVSVRRRMTGRWRGVGVAWGRVAVGIPRIHGRRQSGQKKQLGASGTRIRLFASYCLLSMSPKTVPESDRRSP